MDAKKTIIKQYSKNATLGINKKDVKESSGMSSIKEINDNLIFNSMSLASIEAEFKSLNKILDRTLLEKNKEAYAQEEKLMEAKAVPEEKQQAASIGSDIKSLSKNPAFGIAMAGLLYSFLPKDMQETIKNALFGFAEGVSEGIGPLSELSTEVKIAGGALATFLGSRVLTKVIDAVTTVIRITKTLASMPGRFGRMSKIGKAAALGTVGAVGIAAGREYFDKEEPLEPFDEEPLTTTAPISAAAAAPAATTSDAVSKVVKTSPEPAPPPVPVAKTDRVTPQPVSKPKATASKPLTTKTESKPTKAEYTESPAGTGITPGAQLGFKAGGTGGFKLAKDMIMYHEGKAQKVTGGYKPYRDSLGLWTVGVGHLIGNGKSLSKDEQNRIYTEEEVNSLFEQDFEHHKKAAEKIPGYSKLGEKGKAALIDLTFNMGPAWYKKWPNFVKQLENEDYQGAAINLEGSKWYKQVGRRGPTIVSLIRGESSGVMETATSTPQITPSQVPQLEVVRPGKGSTLAEMSEKIEAAPTSSNFSQVNNIDRSSAKKIGNKQADTPPPIPSPIASRRSLSGISHSTSYA